MPNINSKLIDIVRKITFYIILGIIVIIFIFNQIIAIILACIFFIVILVWYSINLSSKRRLLERISSYLILGDTEIADMIQRPIDEIRKTLAKLAKNQTKKKWLIALVNNRYIFLNEKGVEKFMQSYEQGYNEKKILESLQNEMRISSRAEVRAIQNTLSSHNRLTTSNLDYKKG